MWNYEAGAKGRLFGGRIRFDVAGYRIRWRNIQQAIRLPGCGFGYLGNLGSASGGGGEVSLSATPLHGVTVGANLGLARMRYDADVFGGNGLLLRAKGQRIGGPRWTGLVYGAVERALDARATGYARADLSFAGRGIVQAVPGTFGSDPGLTAPGATRFVAVRVGVRVAALDLSLFADNATGAYDVLARNHDGVSSLLYYDQSYRPRTIGATARLDY